MDWNIILRVGCVWVGFMLAAIVNGGVRELLLKLFFGERIAHAVSTLLLSAIVLLIAFGTQKWLGIHSQGTAWWVSISWVAATLAFEFLAGHYLFGNPWSKIIADYRITEGRVWLLVPATVLVAAPLAWVGIKPVWLAPYLASNLIASMVLLFAITKPAVARWLIVALFLYAGGYNIWLGLNRPMEYQGFAELAIVPWYRDFILGPFRDLATTMIPAIGVGQLLVAAFSSMGGKWMRVGMVGCCVFLLAIAPLGVGSACPFSFIVSLAASIVAFEKR